MEKLIKIGLECFILKTDSKHEIGIIYIDELVSLELFVQLDYAEPLEVYSVFQQLVDDEDGVENGQKGKQSADVRRYVFLIRYQKEWRRLINVYFTQNVV